MEIPEEFAVKAADDIRVLINRVLSIASDITIARNPIRLLQVILYSFLVFIKLFLLNLFYIFAGF